MQPIPLTTACCSEQVAPQPAAGRAPPRSRTSLKRMLAIAWQENSAKMIRMMTVDQAADDVAQLTDAVCSSGVAAPTGHKSLAS